MFMQPTDHERLLALQLAVRTARQQIVRQLIMMDDIIRSAETLRKALHQIDEALK